MVLLLNVLGALVLVFLVVLRHLFDEAIGKLPNPAGANGRRIRLLLGPAAVAFVAFLVAGLWALVDGGYWVVALLVLVHVAMLLHGMWSYRPNRERP